MAIDVLSFVTGLKSAVATEPPIDFGDTITDSWDMIIANANQLPKIISNQQGVIGANGAIFGNFNESLGFNIGDAYYGVVKSDGVKTFEGFFSVTAGTGIYTGYNVINYNDDVVIVDKGSFNYTSEPISVSHSNITSWTWLNQNSQYTMTIELYKNHYKVHDTKTLEYICNGAPIAVQYEIIGRYHDLISDTQNRAALTFVCKYPYYMWRINPATGNTGGWMGEDGNLYEHSLDIESGGLKYGTEGRKQLYQHYLELPEFMQSAIKTVDKIYDDSNGLQTAKEKLFLLSTTELGFVSQNYMPGQGAQYEAYSDTNSREYIIPTSRFTTTFLRSRYLANTNFTTHNVGGTSAASAATGTTFFKYGFCL